MKGLFIKAVDLKRGTIIDGSLDEDIIIPFIDNAQVMNIQPYLGSKLFNRLSAGIVAGDLTTDEEFLIDNYIQDSLIFFTVADYLPFSGFKIQAGGTYAHTSDNAILATPNELDKLAVKYLERAHIFASRLVEYLCANSELFPLYTEAQIAPDMTPDKDVEFYAGFYMGDSI